MATEGSLKEGITGYVLFGIKPKVQCVNASKKNGGIFSPPLLGGANSITTSSQVDSHIPFTALIFNCMSFCLIYSLKKAAHSFVTKLIDDPLSNNMLTCLFSNFLLLPGTPAC